MIVTDSENTKKLTGSQIQLTDDNNKIFLIDSETFQSIDSDMPKSNGFNVKDFESSNYINFQTVITDSENKLYDREDLVKDIKSGLISHLNITYEATHTGDNLNHVIYTPESMVKDSLSWTQPFNKPFIKNHDVEAEPLGRAIDATYRADSELCPGRGCIDVTFKVSDEDAMVKSADGRYLTMSMGASVGTAQCNICDKHILKDNAFKFCGHMKGEKYKDKVALWKMTDLVYKEGSVVNTPADTYAQVKKIVAVKRGEKTMDNKDSNLSTIDGLLGTVPVAPIAGSTPVAPVADSTPVTPVTPVVAVVATDEQKIKALEDKVVILNSEVTTLTSDSVTKDAVLKTATDRATVLEGEILKANVLADSYKAQAINLAIMNKDMLIERLTKLDKTQTEDSLKAKTTVEINQMITDFETKVPVTVVPPVTNPGSPIADSNTVTEDPIASKAPRKYVTLRDCEEKLGLK